MESIRAILDVDPDSELLLHSRYGKEDDSALDVAAASGQLEIMRELIRRGANVNALDRIKGFNVFFRAGLSDRASEAIDILVAAGGHVNSEDSAERNSTALHYFANLGSSDAVAALLRHGAKVNKKDKRGATPIHLAAGNGHVDVVKALIAAGAHLSSRLEDDSCMAALDIAATKGHVSVLEVLLDGGAKTYSVDLHGRTALHAAAHANQVSCIDHLVHAGANINAADRIGRTPLHAASTAKGTSTAVAALVRHGADMDSLDKKKHSPLISAVEARQLSPARELLLAGADVSARHGPLRKTLLHQPAVEGNIDMLRLLLQHGADVNACTTTAITPLRLASSRDHPKAIDMLVCAGAEVESTDRLSCTALYAACQTSSLRAVRALLRNGANPTGNDWNPPLHGAATRVGSEKAVLIADLLLRNGADETKVNRQRYTAAELAMICDRKNSLKSWVMSENRAKLAEHDRQRQRLLDLLARAPADRAWRRRGLLALSRACPDRVNIAGDSSGIEARVLGLKEEELFRKVVWFL